MKRTAHSMLLLAFAAAAGCTTEAIDTSDGEEVVPPTSTTGGVDTTYDHDNAGYSPWEYIERLQQEGPPRYTSKVHSCPKVRYQTLGTILGSLGVNMAATDPLSANQLYRNGQNAMGAPNFANRIRENIGVTTSGASRTFDIFAAAADEIIAAVPTLERCQIGGVGVQLFDGDACRTDGITCVLGVPATPAHLEFCNAAVRSATAGQGQRIAVASMLAAAYTCE